MTQENKISCPVFNKTNKRPLLCTALIPAGTLVKGKRKKNIQCLFFNSKKGNRREKNLSPLNLEETAEICF